MKDIVIIGSGGFSKQVIEIVEQKNLVEQQYNLIGIIDDNRELIGNNVLGYNIIGDTEYLQGLSEKRKIYGVIAIADGITRKRIARKLMDVIWENLIHPKAIITQYKNLGNGNIICAGVVINPNFKIGNHCHINIGSTLGHDVTMSNYVTLMPGSTVSGKVTLKSSSMVGTGSTIIQGITVQENVILGAGAVVLKDTNNDSIYVGVPAKKVRDIN